MVTKVDDHKRHPLSLAQARLWLEHEFEPEGTAYNIPYGFRLRGHLDIKALRQSVNAIVERHAALRTTIGRSDAEAYQIVHDDVSDTLRVIDLRSLDPDVQRVRETEIASEEAGHVFDLENESLFRMAVVLLRDDESLLLLSFHHIIIDGVSIQIFFREFGECYNAFSQGRSWSGFPLPMTYTEFASRQRTSLTDSKLQAHRSYWKERLKGPLPLLQLPSNRPLPAVRRSDGAHLSKMIDAGTLQKIRILSRSQRSTVFMTLMAAFDALMYRYTGQEDLILGIPVSLRPMVEVERLVGLFLNTLVIRTSMEGDPTFEELLRRVRADVLEAMFHQDYPFEELVRELQPSRKIGQTPFFEVMFSQNAEDSLPELPGLAVEPVHVDSGGSKFETSVFVTEVREGLRIRVEYSTELFEEKTIWRVIGHYERVLNAITANPRCRISEIPLLTDEEAHQVLIEWNDTAREYPLDVCVQDLFENQVQQSPDAVAVVEGNTSVTYRELDARANSLAARLRRLGVGADVPVAICLPRSVDMIVGVLGILKSGGAFVPLDPDLPAERISYMLSDSQASALITTSNFLPGVPSHDRPVLFVDGDDDVSGAEMPLRTSGSALRRAESLAYIIYTSGSTGRPKGVMIPHRALVNYILWSIDAYDVRSGHGIPLITSLAFDFTLTCIFTPLLTGRTIYTLFEGASAEELRDFLMQHRGWSLVKMTPAHLTMLNQIVSPIAAEGMTHALIIGGEELRAEKVEFWRRNAPSTSIVNEYGPTETVVGCCTYTVPKDDVLAGGVPIGRPIANTRLYILGRNMEPVPVGTPGELFIGGMGVGRGYQHQAALTGEKFVADPFCSDSGSRLFKSGDRARYRSDGVIEFLGRLDDQVKIRGYRIEPGEIESLLKEHPHVREAVVDVRSAADGEKKLVAYVITKGEATMSTVEAIAYLRTKLPQYMIPSSVVFIDTVPLTPNGKIDRRRLPDPEPASRSGEPFFVAPRTPIEQRVAGIFAEVLGVQRVGLHDVFFDLGGHSLSAIRVVLRLAQEIGVEVSLRDLFEHPSVESLAEVVDCARQNRSVNQKTV